MRKSIIRASRPLADARPPEHQVESFDSLRLFAPVFLPVLPAPMSSNLSASQTNIAEPCTTLSIETCLLVQFLRGLVVNEHHTVVMT